MARESRNFPRSMRRVYSRFGPRRSAHTGRLRIPRGCAASQARGFPQPLKFAFGVWRAEAAAGIGETGCPGACGLSRQPYRLHQC